MTELKLSLGCFGYACSKNLYQIAETIKETFDEMPDNCAELYIGNPQSFYYYQGYNPVKLLAKAVLLFDYRLITIPEEKEAELILCCRQQAKLAYQRWQQENSKRKIFKAKSRVRLRRFAATRPLDFERRPKQ